MLSSTFAAKQAGLNAVEQLSDTRSRSYLFLLATVKSFGDKDLYRGRFGVQTSSHPCPCLLQFQKRVSLAQKHPAALPLGEARETILTDTTASVPKTGLRVRILKWIATRF